MRKLYWKIFISFWIVTTAVIIATTYITGLITHQSSIPISEKVFISSYANAAVATYESGRSKALLSWLNHIERSKSMTIYLLSSTGGIYTTGPVPPEVKRLSTQYLAGKLPDTIFQRDKYIVSHEILTLSQRTYRVAAYLHTPISHLTLIPWADIGFVILFVIALSGTLCYFLSLYLTKPIRNLQEAARSIAHGKLKTRVGSRIKRHDEIAELGQDFDSMAEHIEHLIISKERLLQDISHELRSPLARLRVATAIARNNHQESTYDRMELEIERLDELIGDIMTLAKMQTSKVILNKKPFSLKSVIQEIVDDANFEFSRAKVQLHEITDDLIVNADEKLIHHALENIIRNALKYTDSDTTVSVFVTMNNDTIGVEVLDQGPGVPKEYLDKIFDPFLRVDSSRTASTGGYGLGLAIAKKAIKIHGGHIVAKNHKPNGLKVSVTIPMQ
jgi:two-component system sensor histidine kinase CpxA